MENKSKIRVSKITHAGKVRVSNSLLREWQMLYDTPLEMYAEYGRLVLKKKLDCTIPEKVIRRVSTNNEIFIPTDMQKKLGADAMVTSLNVYIDSEDKLIIENPEIKK